MIFDALFSNYWLDNVQNIRIALVAERDKTVKGDERKLADLCVLTRI